MTREKGIRVSGKNRKKPSKPLRRSGNKKKTKQDDENIDELIDGVKNS